MTRLSCDGRDARLESLAPFSNDEFEPLGYFDQTYAAWEWLRNRAAQGVVETFAIDGAGGQFVLWRRADEPIAQRAVTTLSRDGEALVLAASVGEFIERLKKGDEPRFMHRSPSSAARDLQPSFDALVARLRA